MTFYELRPPRVEARVVIVNGGHEDWVSVEQWCGGTIRLDENGPRCIEFETLNGAMDKAYAGDWIVKSLITNKFYKLSSAVFNKTYREALDD